MQSKNPIRLRYSLLFWTLVSIAFMLQQFMYLSRYDWDFNWYKFLIIPFGYLLWAPFVPFVHFFHTRYPFQKRYSKFVLPHLLASAVVAIVINLTTQLVTTALMYYLDPRIYKKLTASFLDYWDVRALGGALGHLFIYWFVLCFFLILDYYKKYRTEAVKRAEAEKLLSEAQLNALKMQLQPHFLFNTLHSVASLMEENVKEAQDMVGRLGDLLRTSLECQADNFISLRKELEFIENYLSIEKARFQDRLQIHYEVDDSALDASVPSLILQPLVENAIKHGFATKSRSGRIAIRCQKIDGQLRIDVTDDGPGVIDLDALQESNGIGLQNTQERLRTLYGADFKFEFKNAESGGFVVAMTLPYRREQES